MTTRKKSPSPILRDRDLSEAGPALRRAAGSVHQRGLFAALAIGAFLLNGCATPGPLHVYSVPASSATAISDAGHGSSVHVPSFVEPGENVIGFAYDPFTDHFFLRLDSGTRIRVVDRPARAIKREFDIDASAAADAADLAVRPRDGHLFLLAGTAVLETTRLGKTVRKFSLADAPNAPVGIALDTARDQLLVLHSDGRRITRHMLDGTRAGELSLERAAGASLAFDSEKRELYATLRDGSGAIGVFDERGRWVRMADAKGSFVDVGPRSFVRVF